MYVEPIILSGTDGIITVFNLLIGLNAAEINIDTITKVVTIAIIGDAISMTISYYNSKYTISKDHNKLIIESALNFLSFVVFGYLVVFLYTLFKNVIISAIISSIFLGIIKSYMIENGFDFVLSLKTCFLVIIGSFMVYLFGRMMKS